MKMKYEYLSAVAKVQEKIRNKYMKLFDPSDRFDAKTCSWSGFTDEKSHDASEEAIQNEFPGPYAEYYT